jgi:hypothetical protein
VRGLDRGHERVGELALLRDALRDRGTARLELAQVGEALLERAQLCVVQPFGGFLAVA